MKPKTAFYIAAGLALIGGGKMASDSIEVKKNKELYTPSIKAAAEHYGVPFTTLFNLINAESAFRTSVINGSRKSTAGAVGIAQFMPATAKQFGIDPTNPLQSIDAAAKYLSQLFKLFGGDWVKAVAAYNWGQGNVQRKGLKAAPLETRNYVKKILGVTI